jgi:hypothetical protein
MIAPIDRRTTDIHEVSQTAYVQPHFVISAQRRQQELFNFVVAKAARARHSEW